MNVHIHICTNLYKLLLTLELLCIDRLMTVHM